MATVAVVSAILKELISFTADKVQLSRQFKLVTGVTKEIKKLTSNFQAIQAVLIDAEQRQFKDRVVANWLDKLKDVSYDMDDVLDEWNTAILKLQIEGVPKKKVCFCIPFPRFSFKQVVLRRGIGFRIKKIDERLDLIAKEKDAYNLNVRSILEPEQSKTTSFVDVSKIVGRDAEKDSLVSMLLSEREEKSLYVISIVGMGGIGKTMLAQFAYNDEKVKSHFHKRIWICVSQPFDELRIAKAIIEGFTDVVSNSQELQSLLNHIHESVVQTKFLLILDDVWNENYNKWEPLYNTLNNGLHGSKILVTTRKTIVAHIMNSVDIINIEKLSENESWLLFKQLAFSGRSQQECEILVETGIEIVGKCKGLPLAIKTVGSLLRFKKTKEQWKRILNSEMWKLEELEDVFLPLLLSYNDLPSKVKQCFLYCAIYPKDYNIKKDELVKLWMAQGYLDLEQNDDLELIGEEYFDNLAMRSFFQEFEKDEDGNIIECKMHDIVHDFALHLVKKEGFAMEINSCEVASLNSSYEKVYHLMLIMNNNETSFPLMNRFSIQELRSLLVEAMYATDSLIRSELLQSHLFKRLARLKVLELKTRYDFRRDSHSYIIPKETGKLIHLRYLNMGGLNIIKLPDTLCDLYNLQTLDLSRCWNLQKLPQEMGKLVKLRHLILDNTYMLKQMPKGVEKLSNLRTLSKLVVGVRDGGGREVCRLDCLKNLNHLRGELSLEALNNVSDEGEAKNASLKNKENILGLHLYFGVRHEYSVVRSEASSNKDEAVLEALESPPYLKELEISCYGGIAFPNWIVSLTHLKEISLDEAFKCEHLSALGKLPLLETLHIKEMRRLKRVGNEFLGVENSSSSSSPLIAFPQLKRLEFRRLEEWEEWDYENRKDIIIMPSLSYLRIDDCPKLKALPDHLLHSTSLKQIFLEKALKYAYLPALGKLPLLETLKICNMSRLKRVGNAFLGVENRSSSFSPLIAFPQLKSLEFGWLEEWEEWDYENRKDILTMPSLSSLSIYVCPDLKALPDHLLHSTSLKQIFLESALKYEYLPALGKLPLLETLKICDMSRLKRVGNEFLGVENSSSSSSPVTAFPKLERLEFASMPEWEEWDYENTKDIIIMPSLSSFRILYCYKLKALPDHLLHSTSLEEIVLKRPLKCEYLPALGKLPLLETLEICDMRTLKRVGNEFLGVENNSSSSSRTITFPKLKHLTFQWMHEWEEWDYENTKDIIIMPSLSFLFIYGCPKLKALPDHLLHSTSLQILNINDCSVLEKWCQTKGIEFASHRILPSFIIL